MVTSYKLTTENIRTDVGRTATLVFQEVIFTDQVFAETEVGDSDTSTPLVENHVAQLEVTVYYVFLSKRKYMVIEKGMHKYNCMLINNC